MDRYKKYIEEHCKNCKNRKSNLCDIRVFCIDGIVETKCASYLREEKKVEKKKIEYTTASKHKPLMRGLI